MDVLPDFTTISDDELKALIERYVREEEEVSYRRRLLHGKIDILRAELVDRVKRREAGTSTTLSEIDIDRLTDILAHRGPPPGLDDEHGSPPGGEDEHMTAARSAGGSVWPTALSADTTTASRPASAAAVARACSSPTWRRADAGLRGLRRGGGRRGHERRSTPEGAMLVIRIGGGRAGEQFSIDADQMAIGRGAERRRSSWTTSPSRASTPCSSAATTGCTCPTPAA